MPWSSCLAGWWFVCGYLYALTLVHWWLVCPLLIMRLVVGVLGRLVVVTCMP